jgi:hypothetical protein
MRRTTIQQAWHIVRKDARHLRREIGLLLALAAVVIWRGSGDAISRGELPDALVTVFVAAVAFTVARLVQSEAIAGQNQFWITRPYRWTSLLLAKILFLAAFIHLPVLLAQATILLVNGFGLTAILPGLLWTQVLILVAISLPAFALASLSAGLVPYIASALLILASGVVVVEISDGNALLRWPSGYYPGSIEWVRIAFPALVAAIAMPFVLYGQYRYRRTGSSRILAATAAIVAVAAFTGIPGRTLFYLQTLTSKQPIHVQVNVDHRLTHIWFPQTRDLAGRPGTPGLTIHIPYTISGMPEDVHAEIEMYDVQLVSANGRTLHMGTGWTSMNKSKLEGTIYPTRSFVEQAGGAPMTLRVSIYLSLFGNRRDQTIALQETPVDGPDGLRCFETRDDEVICRAPFRWPGRLISVKSSWGSLSSFTHHFSYSPFPANLQLEPIAERSAGPQWSKVKPAKREVTIETEDPLAFVQREIEVSGIYLTRR